MKDVYEQMMARQRVWYRDTPGVSVTPETTRYSNIMGTSVDVRKAEEIGFFSERSDLGDILRESGF